jgi:hypothetical protein
MRNKVLANPSSLETTENRAQACQSSRHPPFLHIGNGPRDRKLSAAWLAISWPCLAIVFVVGLPAALGAQIQQDPWSKLTRLKAGQGIEVIESSMRNHNGKFVAVSDQALTLQEHGSEVSLKRAEIARVSTSSGPRRGEHAVIGLVTGGLIGAAVGAASGSKTGFLGGSSRGITALIGIAIGAPTGAGVGVALPARTTVYRATPTTASQQAVSGATSALEQSTNAVRIN